MIDFNFISPTKIYFGKNKENEIGNIIKSYGFKNIMIVYGMNSVIKSGLLDKVTTLLKKNDIAFILFGGVRANPTREKVLEGVKLAKENKVDLLLAIGGGSVMDCSKSIGVGYYYDKDPFDFNMHIAKPTRTLPVGVILTIAASGSELSNSCVIQEDSTGMKKGFNNDIIRPLFVIEDPLLTYTTPRFQTSCGIIDMMMHTFERYFSLSDNNEIADEFAQGILKSVYDAGLIANKEPTNYEARATLMLASSLSHNGLTSIGKVFQFPCHYLEHILSGVYPSVAHGAGLAVIFPAWLEEYQEVDSKKMAKLAKIIFDIDCKSEKEGATIFLAKIREFFALLGMPSNFKELGIANADIDRLTEQFLLNGTRVIDHGSKPLDQALAKKIFLKCN